MQTVSKIKVANRQTIWDIALQYYGSPMGVLLLIDDNPGVLQSVDDVLNPGMVLNIKSAVINPALVAAMADANVQPATGGDESLFSNSGYLLTEDLQAILTESQTPIGLENAPIDIGDGNFLTTEDGDNLLTE